ncbi:unnamed protein product [Hyaloperonospora brassicae]|uniref:Tyrosine-protein kinase ephrin type A/B receptor-like domain-containing protein n=1 Tax=Hyaloperonospora brassicae TaxID=162125 RepID=A0AAV0T9A6_HYABA|nr:unnamed protein product [Hyaloperonospora brassicae]
MASLHWRTRRRAAGAWPLSVLALSTMWHCTTKCLADAALVTGPSSTFRIDHDTKIPDIFKCSDMHFIGSFNEYYVTCALDVPEQASIKLLEIVNVTLDSSDLSPLRGVHAELTFKLNSSLAAVSIRNSHVRASAVEIDAANITIDSHSVVNVTARGLKFGPGYNSWSAMGGSYGGIGGASLTARYSDCDNVPPNDFFRAIGDVGADMANFRGYGSGGGNEKSRGGGRIRLVADSNVAIDGKLVASGGDACTDCYDSAGAGGSVVVVAKGRIYGNGTVQADGGEPSKFSGDGFVGGGGGGGGGGRIVLDSANGEELEPGQVSAYGGGGLTAATNDGIGWCQLGGDGTILRAQHTAEQIVKRGRRLKHETGSQAVVSTLLVRGSRLAHVGPVRRIQIYGCTPMFEQTPRGGRFLPESLVHMLVNGGATVCASVIELKDSIGGIESTIELDSGSELNALGRGRSIQLSASQVTIQGYVGPSLAHEQNLFSLALRGVDISFSDALAMLHDLEVDARGRLSIDKFSVLNFGGQVSIRTDASAQIDGFLKPSGTSIELVQGGDAARIPSISVTSKLDVEFCPQVVEMGPIQLQIAAKGSAVLDMPFDTPFLKLLVSAVNVSIANLNSGPVRECRRIEHQADASACTALRTSNVDDQPYLVSVFASESATLGNISAGSMILCSSSNMTIGGMVTSSRLGCGSGVGPGKSKIVGEASGGAGHGGRGGNVLPGSIGGGAAYEVPADFEMHQDALLTTMNFGEGWPVWPGSGAASGDTLRQVIGGSGGGLIYIGVTNLNLTKAASVSARGGIGSMGGGGGSGGSLTLFIADIAGGGTIDLAGGSVPVPVMYAAESKATNESSIWNPHVTPGDFANAAGKIGGGGGGGIVRVTYVDTADNSSAGNGETFVKDGGRIVVDGGESVGGENGGAGVSIGVNCYPGRGGVFCLPCPEGSHSPDRFSKCLPCGPGTCSSRAGSERCDACSIGHFNSDFGKKECQPCPLGSFGAKAGLKKCEMCPPGSFAGSTGSNECLLCPVGDIAASSGSANCTRCGIGETTAKAGATTCAGCTNKPVHSEFNMPGNCSYACSKGRNGLDCLTPFEHLVKPIGGPLGFALVVFAATSLIFCVWGFISYWSSRLELHRYAQYRAKRLRDELSLKTLTKMLTPRLTDQDLNAHVARLYFTGDNHVKSAWRLDPCFLPESLRDIVEVGTYARFASTCNKLMEWDLTSWEVWLYRFLVITLPPFGTLFMRRCQLHRVVKLVKYIEGFGGGFFRGINFRVHGTQLKIGFSPDFSLGYLDVLISPSASSSSANLSAMQIADHEDLVLVVGGSGSFFRPYHLDSNDIIVRAVPSRLQLLEHMFWIDFVADMNQKLRVLPQPSSVIRRVAEAAKVARDIIICVAAFNRDHGSDGFAVVFGTFVVGETEATGASTRCFQPLSSKNVDATFASYPQIPFKLAFRISRSNVPAASHASVKKTRTAVSDYPDLLPEDNERGMAETDPRSAEFRFSKIRTEALFVQPEREHAGISSDASDSLLLSKTQEKHSTARQTRMLVKLLCRNDTAKRWLTTLWRPVYPLFRLRNLPRPEMPARWLLSVMMVLLIIADMGVAFWIIVEYYCVQIRDPSAQDAGCSRTALWSVLGILPAAIAGSPLLGLAFVTRKSIFCGKLFALWNASSVVNQAVAFVGGIVYLKYIHDDILLVALGGVLIKYFEKEVALRCIAQYASERPLRGWRGLHTTRDWYDAAYTPLVHHER